MKRLRWAVFFGALSVAALAQEAPRHEDAAERAAESPSQGEHGNLELWKWANFLLLAGGLGYLVVKKAGPFFAARTKQIQQEMMEAEELRKDAEARALAVDRRLANLETDIAALRAEAQAETQAETERSSRHTEAEIAKIRSQTEQEIASAGKAARMELKRYSAELALGLAEQKIRARMTPETQDALLRGFMGDLDKPSSRAQSI